MLYRRPGGHTTLEVRLAGDSVWLTQSQIAKLFGVNVPAISKHIKNIYITRELQPKSTVSKMEIVRKEGKRQVSRPVDLYSLDMIISVGYRVNSTRATQFRIWEIALELTEKLHNSTTVDWQKRESVRARLRNLVRITLRRYKYPPDKQDEAIRLVLEQAERLSDDWSKTVS